MTGRVLGQPGEPRGVGRPNRRGPSGGGGSKPGAVHGRGTSHSIFSSNHR
jgi:hypothetical protein